MSKNVKNISLQDGGMPKNFVINKMFAMHLYDLTSSILDFLKNKSKANDNSSISDSETMYLAFKYTLNAVMATGFELTDEQKQLSAKYVVKFAEVVFNEVILSHLDMAERRAILAPLLLCIRYTPGAENIILTLDNVNNNVIELKNFYTLILEALKLNYDDFFPKTAEANT